ncbi:S8 family peptidase [Enterobacter cloacae]|uniref:S8 family peptidase n=1 Tax=Enterobacter cloacae TaxID=550 RepID=UPI0021CF7D48|nr:S8 family peptidase [Enterobacter cloacae]MCU6207316.1 S8 family peptidase [Enterobacter cloacae]
MRKPERPIKVIKTFAKDFNDKSYGFGEKEPIRPVTKELMARLKSEVRQVSEHFKDSFRKWPGVPAVAKVTLHDKALAKSHRPTSLLGDKTCPVIGSCNFGELLVSVTEDGLSRLETKIQNSTKTKSGTLHIAVIDKIEPYICDKVIDHESESYILKLFDHKNRKTNKSLEESLKLFLAELKIPEPSKHTIGGDMIYFEVPANNNIVALSNFIGIRKLQPMPSFKLDNNEITLSKIASQRKTLLPTPDTDIHYPLVGIIDSGIDPNNRDISPWVWGRRSFLGGRKADYTHGNMIASLIIDGKGLNNNTLGFPNTQAEIVDIAAFPADTELTLPELANIVITAVEEFPEVKIWNLSLGQKEACHDDNFSEMGHLLSYLHDEYGCLFVVASGNYEALPQRTWPPQDLSGGDRVSAPGDSVRALTVGSVAHLDCADSIVKAREPSSFSRRGPGPSCIPKPEVTHFGGNCRENLDFSNLGIRAIGENGYLSESVGTSLSTPLISSIAASAWHELQLHSNTAPSPERVKALIIHSAMLERTEQIDPKEINYHGFGIPKDNIIEMLSCKESEITFLFEVDTREGVEFGRYPFVIPDSLRNEEGKFFGEILMTLVYSPPLDPNYPSEYCRSNVDVSFGTYDYDKAQKRKHISKVPQIKDKSELYEKYLIENGFKWSPIKVYRKKYPQGTQGDTWRLKIDVQRRAEQDPLEFPQRAVLLITLRSLSGQGDIYSEAIDEIDALGWESDDIIVSSEERIQIR